MSFGTNGSCYYSALILSDGATERDSGGDEEKYKNMELGTLRFRVITLWRRVSQPLFSIRQISCQTILCQIVANVGVKRIHIVTHNYAASFSIKTTFSSAKKTQKETKPMRDCESTSKVKVRSL